MNCRLILVMGLGLGAACSAPAPPLAEPAAKPADAQHAGLTTPHGDHSPHHGGMVLMNGELHYEVVLDRAGRHRIWFSDAVREELPASVASKVVILVSRKDAPEETITLAIDDTGESWIAAGHPVLGDDAMVKISFVARGEAFEVEAPFITPAK